MNPNTRLCSFHPLQSKRIYMNPNTRLCSFHPLCLQAAESAERAEAEAKEAAQRVQELSRQLEQASYAHTLLCTRTHVLQSSSGGTSTGTRRLLLCARAAAAASWPRRTPRPSSFACCSSFFKYSNHSLSISNHSLSISNHSLSTASWPRRTPRSSSFACCSSFFKYLLCSLLFIVQAPAPALCSRSSPAWSALAAFSFDKPSTGSGKKDTEVPLNKERAGGQKGEERRVQASGVRESKEATQSMPHLPMRPCVCAGAKRAAERCRGSWGCAAATAAIAAPRPACKRHWGAGGGTGGGGAHRGGAATSAGAGLCSVAWCSVACCSVARCRCGLLQHVVRTVAAR